MKKIKKINLELNKEVISSLSNEDMNQVKGGASTYKQSAIYDNRTICMSCPVDTTPTLTGAASKCLCIATNDCASQGNNWCAITHGDDCEIILNPITRQIC